MPTKITSRDVRALARAMRVNIVRESWYGWSIHGVDGWYTIDGHQAAMDAIRQEAIYAATGM